jgi:cytochrome o ubiquinol oxidase subunit IV
MSKKKIIAPLPNHAHASIATYVSGFVLSVALTVGAFAIVMAYDASDGELLSQRVLVVTVTLFAVAQLAVQSLFFLHLSARPSLRPTVYSTVFTVATLLTIVIGSIWIMNNLNYNMGHDKGTVQYIQEKENIDSSHAEDQ